MSATATSLEARVDRDDRVLIPGISWDTYVQIGDLLRERPNLRLTYDRGRLEIMTLSSRHERLNSLLALLVTAITDELGIARASCGSMTCRREDLERGFEPDRCFYIGQAARAITRMDLDLQRDPPPTLSIEVDVSRSSIDRQSLYAKFGIRELWRHADGVVRFLHLQDDGTFSEQPNSQTFPKLTAADINRFLDEFTPATEMQWGVSFRQWVRDELAAR